MFRIKPTSAGLCMAVFTLAAAGLTAYWNSFRGVFLFDDLDWIVRNPTIRQLWPLGPVLLPELPGSTIEGRPLLNLSFAINYHFGGLSPWGYHAVNLAIHILSGMALFGIVRRTLTSPSSSAPEPMRASTPTLLALWIALIWLVHPLNTESVTYIIQRGESLAGLFYLLTLYGGIRWFQDRAARGWAFGSIIACFLGVATKETVATAPLIVLLYDRQFVAQTFRKAWRVRAGYYVGLASSWALLAALLLTHGGSHGGSIGLGRGVSAWSYARMQAIAVVDYLKLSFFPHPLIFDYGVWTEADLGSWPISLVLLLALLLGVGVAFRFQRKIAFLGAAFFCILAPTSSVIPIITQTAAEHRMYLPLAAVITLAVLSVHVALKAALAKPAAKVLGKPSPDLLTGMVASVAVVLLGWTTHARNKAYASEYEMWKDNVRKLPTNSRALASYAKALDERGESDLAIEAFEKSLALADNAQTWNDYGVALAARKRLDEAMGCFRRAITLRSNYGEARANLGLSLLAQGKYREGLEEFRRALEGEIRSPELRKKIADAVRNAPPSLR